MEKRLKLSLSVAYSGKSAFNSIVSDLDSLRDSVKKVNDESGTFSGNAERISASFRKLAVAAASLKRSSAGINAQITNIARISGSASGIDSVTAAFERLGNAPIGDVIDKINHFADACHRGFVEGENFAGAAVNIGNALKGIAGKQGSWNTKIDQFNTKMTTAATYANDFQKAMAKMDAVASKWRLGGLIDRMKGLRTLKTGGGGGGGSSAGSGGGGGGGGVSIGSGGGGGSFGGGRFEEITSGLIKLGRWSTHLLNSIHKTSFYTWMGIYQTARSFTNRIATLMNQMHYNANRAFGLMSAAGVGAFAALATAGVSMNVTLEGAQRAFTRILGSSSKAKSFVEEIRKEATISKLTFRELLPLGQSLAAIYGEKGLGKVIPTLRAIGDAAVTLNVETGAIDRALLGVRQLISSGSGKQEEVKQIFENLPGVNTDAYLTKSFGTADTEVLAKAGVTGKQVAEAIINGITEQFGGAQLDAAKSLPIMFSNLGDTFDYVAAQITRRFTPQLTIALEKLMKWMAVIPQNERLMKALATPFELFGQLLIGVADGLPRFAEGLQSVLSQDNIIGFLSNLYGAFRVIGDQLNIIGNALSDGKTITNPMQALQVIGESITTFALRGVKATAFLIKFLRENAPHIGEGLRTLGGIIWEVSDRILFLSMVVARLAKGPFKFVIDNIVLILGVIGGTSVLGKSIELWQVLVKIGNALFGIGKGGAAAAAGMAAVNGAQIAGAVGGAAAGAGGGLPLVVSANALNGAAAALTAAAAALRGGAIAGAANGIGWAGTDPGAGGIKKRFDLNPGAASTTLGTVANTATAATMVPKSWWGRMGARVAGSGVGKFFGGMGAKLGGTFVGKVLGRSLLAGGAAGVGARIGSKFIPFVGLLSMGYSIYEIWKAVDEIRKEEKSQKTGVKTTNVRSARDKILEIMGDPRVGAGPSSKVAGGYAAEARAFLTGQMSKVPSPTDPTTSARKMGEAPIRKGPDPEAIKQFLEGKGSFIDLMIQRAEMMVDALPEAQQPLAKLVKLIPLMRSKQQNILDQTRMFAKSQEDYWDGMGKAMQVEKDIQKMNADYNEERQKNMQEQDQKQRNTLAAKIEYMKARIENNPLLGREARRKGELGLFSEQLRMLATPGIGESEEDKYKRLTEFENTRGEYIASATKNMPALLARSRYKGIMQQTEGILNDPGAAGGVLARSTGMRYDANGNLVGGAQASGNTMVVNFGDLNMLPFGEQVLKDPNVRNTLHQALDYWLNSRMQQAGLMGRSQ